MALASFLCMAKEQPKSDDCRCRPDGTARESCGDLKVVGDAEEQGKRRGQDQKLVVQGCDRTFQPCCRRDYPQGKERPAPGNQDLPERGEAPCRSFLCLCPIDRPQRPLLPGPPTDVRRPAAW